ncbi:MAG: phosphate acetyltransferase [Thiotrichales bacterium]
MGCSYEQASEWLGDGRYEDLVKLILMRFKELETRHDLVLCVGTDFSGVTSAMELDFNIDVANNLGCKLLPVVNGQAGDVEAVSDALKVLLKTIKKNRGDLLAAVINRVPSGQWQTMVQALHRLELPYYVLPEEVTLEKPTVGEIARALNFTLLSGEADTFNHPVRNFKVAAMEIPEFLNHVEDGSLVITPGDRSDIILGTLTADASTRYPKIAGMILSGGLKPAPQVMDLLEGLVKACVPLFISPDDTFQTTLEVSRVRPTILPDDEQKIATVMGLIESCVNPEELRRLIALTPGQPVTPMMFEYELIRRAKTDRKHIVLPESSDARILRAADILMRRDVAMLTLIGEPEKIQTQLKAMGLTLDSINIVDPHSSPWREDFANTYYELRKHKGISEQMAHDALADANYFGTMMVYKGYADGMVSGAAHTTQATIRPAFEIIKTRPGVSLVSSVFFMCLEDRVLVYGDCAINPKPNAEQLADIAITSAGTAERFGIEPRVAMLSYSTGESGKGDEVDRVRRATVIARQQRPDLKLEGPIQYDAAIDPEVARLKMPQSEVAGRATVFIFPDLNTGNNTYKAVQRSANAVAIGPVLQGLKKPVNDLSRGCTVTDIVNTVAITAIQAQL